MTQEQTKVNCPAWYLVYTKPQQEKVAQENLQRQGYETYFPLLRKRIKKGRSFYYRNDPLFPRYIFIHLSKEIDDWGPVRSTVGVTHLVRFGNNAASIPDNLIEQLKANENEQGVCVLPEEELVAGEKVQFIDGSLHGYEAIFKCKTGSDRVLVLMNIAGSYTQLNVPAETIERKSE